MHQASRSEGRLKEAFDRSLRLNILNEMEKPKLSEHDVFALTKLLKKECYTFTPSAEYWAILDKKRVLQNRSLDDSLVHQVLSIELQQKAISTYSPLLYSYQIGKGPLSAQRAFLDWIRAYKKKVSEKKKRGLYVIRIDVKSYTDSIPLNDPSFLIQSIEKLYTLEPTLLETLKNACRSTIAENQSVVFENSGEFQYIVGLPTGSHLTPVLANIYLGTLDAQFEALPQYFYSRYGDDILIGAESAEAILKGEEMLFAQLRNLRLGVNPEKVKRVYFNGAGRKSEELNTYLGQAHLDYLGMRLLWKESYALEPKKLTPWMRTLYRKIKQTLKQLHELDPELPLEIKGKIICTLANEHFIPSHSYTQNILSSAQWKSIHKHLGRVIVYQLTKIPNNTAFRKVSYRTLIHSWGLQLPRGFKREANDSDEEIPE
jgi:hypothetical protein